MLLYTLIMTIEEILDIQTDALSKTICDYSKDNYIRSYAMKLKEYRYPEDKERIGIVVKYLLDWYTTVIESIKKDEYVLSREAHLKSYEYLQKLSKKLGE